MGCTASAPSRGRTVTIDADDAESWNANYHEISEEMSTTLQKMRSTSSMGLGEESTNSTISKEGLNVRSVNGYIFGKNLGKGAFGEVFTAKKGGQKFAIKVLRKSALKKMRMGRMGSALDTVKTEIATMKKIVHPNCVHMFDVILDNRHDEIFLVLEFVEGGNSQKTGADGKPLPLEQKTIWSYMRHLVMGLEYLHMNNIVHRDIKPENLLVTKNGVLKVADFGTSCFCEGDDNAQKTAGTPTFFSPELCTAAGKGTYDARVVDLWAVGVTVHLWLSGAPPFAAETTMLLMNQIRDAPDKVAAPANASKGLQNVMEGLLVKRPDKRLTLNQLRMHPWLTRRSTQPLPAQPVIPVEVSAEDVAMAFTSRAAMQYQSAAGPSALGRLIGKPSDWKREDLNTIRKRTNGAEARFFKAIAGSGALSPHIPVIYSISRIAKDSNTIEEEVGGEDDDDDGLEMSLGRIGAAGGEGSEQEMSIEYASGPASRYTEGRGTHVEAGGGEDSVRLSTPPDGAVPVTKLRSTMQAGPEQVSVQGEDSHEVFHIRMQDLASNMTRPCAMRFIMGDRTVTSENFRDKTLHKSLLDEVKAIDPSAVSAEDDAAGGLTRQRYLSFYDEASSTKALGFRVDGAQLTLPDGRRDNISPPEGKTLDTLREDDDLVQMFLSFVQSDLSLAKQVVLKVSSILAALERSAFFPSHAFLRSSILLTYDDAARETRVEMKLINFQSSYAMPQAQTLQHNQPWSGDVNDREDGYMLGVQSLLRITQLVVAKLEAS